MEAALFDGLVPHVAHLQTGCGAATTQTLNRSHHYLFNPAELLCFLAWHNTTQGLRQCLSAQDVSADGKKALCWFVVLSRVADVDHLHPHSKTVHGYNTGCLSGLFGSEPVHCRSQKARLLGDVWIDIAEEGAAEVRPARHEKQKP